MRLVVLTDSHGNLPAVRAVLREIRRVGYDAIVHTGDAIGIGPYPAESLDLLLNTPRFYPLMGNHELWFAQNLVAHPPPGVHPEGLAHRRWVDGALDPALREVVARWPYSLLRTFHGLRIYFAHYAFLPGSWDFYPVLFPPTAEGLDRLFGRCSADLVFYGHHHPPSDLTGRARYVNPGSLGVSREPLARYVVLEVGEDGRYTLEKRAVPYDNRSVLRELTRREVPARDFIYRVFFGVSPQAFV